MTGAKIMILLASLPWWFSEVWFFGDHLRPGAIGMALVGATLGVAFDDKKISRRKQFTSVAWYSFIAIVTAVLLPQALDASWLEDRQEAFSGALAATGSAWWPALKTIAPEVLKKIFRIDSRNDRDDTMWEDSSGEQDAKQEYRNDQQ